MQRFLIKCVNCAVLIVILIGVPAVASAQFWHWQISSAPTARTLTFWGLVLAASGNVLVATIFLKGRKEQALCAEWTFVFAGLWLLEYAFVRGDFNFDWLKQILLWLQNLF
jgi:hypothetical protein